jgi:ketosteroid isomerase-like protein
MKTRSVIPAAVLLWGWGCALRHRPATPEPARGPARDSLFRFDQGRGELIAGRGLVDGMVSLLAPNVVYLRAGVPAVYGLDGVRELLTAGMAGAPPAVMWEPLGGGVSYDLMAGYTYGVVVRQAPPGGAVHLERYIAVWQRSRGNPWRVIAYTEVESPPAAEVNFSTNVVTPPLVAPPVAIREAVANVRAADSLFSDLADRMGVGFAFSNTIAPQGVLFGSPQLVVGPDATREFYASRTGGSSLTWRPVYAWVTGSRDLGFTVGEYIETGRGPSGAAVQRFGKYLTVWERQRDGTWKFVADGGNATPAKAEK